MAVLLVGAAGCSSPSNWVLMVRPEQRLFIDNATADWSDYTLARGQRLIDGEPFESSAACMAEGRRLFSGWSLFPGREASEVLNGQSIQCVKGCFVDSQTALMICDEVTQPEIFRMTVDTKSD